MKMEKGNLSTKFGIKIHKCYYFDDIIEIEDFGFDNTLLAEYFIVAKALCIIFSKLDMFIRDYGGTKRLVIFYPEKYDFIFNIIRYLIGLKSGITYAFYHNF